MSSFAGRRPRPAVSTHGARALAAGALVAALVGAAPVLAQDLVLRGATLHPIAGDPIPDGVVVVRDGLIASVEAAGSAVAPNGAEVVDAAGLHLYPGFLQAYSTLGLTEIDSVRGTVDIGEVGDDNADLRAELAFNADSYRLPPAVAGGVLTAHVVPRGGRFAGTSAALRLEGWNWEEMTLAAPLALHLEFPIVSASAGEEDGEGAGDSKQVDELNDLVERARRAVAAAEAGLSLGAHPSLERIHAALAGELPLLVHAPQRAQVEKALEWTEEQEVPRWILVSGPDAAYLADELAARSVPVILRNVFSLPSRDFEAYDRPFRAASILHQAGVRFAINGPDASEMVRNLPFAAAMAVAHGLPREVALRAITLSPAEILGIDDAVGSLQQGREATFFLADGDPLEITTSIRRVWIRGEEADLEDDHQRRLWRKYDARPAPAALTDPE